MNLDTYDGDIVKAAFVASGSMALANKIKPLLAGRGPDVQGAALAQLTSLWLAGHDKELREELLELQTTTIRLLVGIDGKEVRGE